ncbi:MAG: GNAT family N-acetyltransferase [Roseiflexaceae bacterium]|nr:GNAT family N-acetyltransferase [Roseiflexaceae bacterium]
MAISVRALKQGDDHVLLNVADDVFDDPIDKQQTSAFLDDPRHHLVVALDDDLVIGFVSAVHSIHPDKPAAELWINEVGVAPTHQGRGIGKSMLQAMLEVGRAHGCGSAWVLTARDNSVAMRLYAGVGGEEWHEDTVMFSFAL